MVGMASPAEINDRYGGEMTHTDATMATWHTWKRRSFVRMPGILPLYSGSLPLGLMAWYTKAVLNWSPENKRFSSWAAYCAATLEFSGTLRYKEATSLAGAEVYRQCCPTMTRYSDMIPFAGQARARCEECLCKL
jgi:hypothetical protein